MPWRPHTSFEAVQCKWNEWEMKDFNKHWEQDNFESVTAAISRPWDWVPEKEPRAWIWNVCHSPSTWKHISGSRARAVGLVTAVVRMQVDMRCEKAAGFECCHLFATSLWTAASTELREESGENVWREKISWEMVDTEALPLLSEFYHVPLPGHIPLRASVQLWACGSPQ